MSLPGLGLEEPDEVAAVVTAQHELSKGCEWRFEVGVGKYVQVKLLTGTAELFGTELVISSTYTFTGTKAAIFTWHGCTFEVSGDALQSEYIAEETPMNEYVNVHFALEILRDQAKTSSRDGPRVLILGPEDAGKTTLAKVLTGYATRISRSPVVVNLDPREGLMSFPGTLTATVFKSLMDVEEGWGTAPMSGPNGAIPVKLPLVYYYGSDRPDETDGKVYKAQVGRLALAVAGRLGQDIEARESGIIIDTPGSLTNTKSGSSGYDIIQHIISEFAVSAIICLGSERLYSDMVKRFDGQPVSASTSRTMAASMFSAETISVIKLAKSGGVVDRDNAYMTAFRASQIRAYFYGNPRLSAGISLQPRQQQIDFSSITLWQRLSSSSSSYSSSSHQPFDNNDDDEVFLPGGIEDDSYNIGASSSVSRVMLPASQLYERVTRPQPAMRSSVLAVLNCEAEAEQDEIRDSSVMGFLYVTDIDEARGKISLLSPVAGRVPERAIVWASWPEGVLGMERG